MSANAAVAKRERGPISRPLKVLIPLIQTDIERGDRAGMDLLPDKLLEQRAAVVLWEMDTARKRAGLIQDSARFDFDDSDWI